VAASMASGRWSCRSRPNASAPSSRAGRRTRWR
jgi:hypothetical protein